ncbi:hypothetical protein ACS0TY_010236 [Phlomoides rotata]
MEKVGGNLRLTSQMEQFQDTLNELELQDLQFNGYRYTWSNGRSRKENVQCRLDRVVANPTWRLLFQTHSVYHQPRMGSDHSLIILNCDRVQHKNQTRERRRKKIFRFEKMWVENEMCQDVVEFGWDPRNSSHTFQERTKACGMHLMAWDSDEFGNIGKKIKDAKKNLGELQTKPKRRR